MTAPPEFSDERAMVELRRITQIGDRKSDRSGGGAVSSCGHGLREALAKVEYDGPIVRPRRTRAHCCWWQRSRAQAELVAFDITEQDIPVRRGDIWRELFLPRDGRAQSVQTSSNIGGWRFSAPSAGVSLSWDQ